MATEFCTDSRTFCFIEDDRSTFDVQYGGRSGTPTIEIPVINGNIVEVTTQFMARNPNGGFYYTIVATSSDAQKITTRNDNVSQKSAGWQSCVRTDYFRISLPQNVAEDDATFEVEFSQNDLNDPGQAGAFLISARLVGNSFSF